MTLSEEIFYVYRKDGSKIQIGGTSTSPEYLCVRELQLDDTFLGQKQVTVTIKSPVPIEWKGQEYIILDEDKYSLKYEPSMSKQARKKTYGEAFVYEDVILQSVTDETTRVKFQDYVNEDNNIHYSSMPTVYFYGTVKDLAERIQANLDRVYSGDSKWVIVLGDDLPTTEKQKTYQDAAVWDAITDIWNVYKVLFYTKGRTLYIGSGASTVPHDFQYGIGKGLKSLKKETSEDNEIYTRLHVYGSQKNLPYRYYNKLGKHGKYTMPVYWISDTQEQEGATYSPDGTTKYIEINVKMGVSVRDDMFTTSVEVKNATVTNALGFSVGISIDGYECNALLTYYDANNVTEDGNRRGVISISNTCTTAGGTSIPNVDFDKFNALYEYLKTTNPTNVVVLSGADFEKTPTDMTTQYGGILLDSMYLPNLMLPLIRYDGDTTKYYDADFKEITDESAAVYRMVKTGNGGKDMDIYLESIKGIEQFGVLEGNVTFDNDDDADFEDLVDDENGIYPTLSVATDGSNEIVSATQMTDAGVFDANGNVSPTTFEVVVKLSFNPNLYKISGETMQISFKSGALIGRTFDFNCTNNDDGTYTLTCNREADNDIGLAFPNSSYNAQAGDKFVFLGIELPDEHIQSAEIRLLNAGLAYLANHDHTLYVYSPELDNIFLARRENKETRDALCAGATFWFTDEDVNGVSEDEAVTIKLPISKLTMKIGSSMIRQYEITLADTPDIDSDIVTRTVQAISNSYASIGGGGVSEGDIKIVGDKRYIRKDQADTMPYLLTLLQGLSLGSSGKYGITGDGVATLNKIITEDITIDGDMVSRLFDELAETGFGLTKDTAGNYSMFLKNITVWGKAIFRELEIRRLSYVGGDFVFSPAGCTIDRVEYIDALGNTVEADDSSLYAYRCHYVADDGTTATTNSFMVDDQARCQTFNLHEIGTYENAANRYYWRRVLAVGDGYLDLSVSDYDTSSDNDTPQKGDVLVCMGNRTNTARQNMVRITTEGDAAPAIELFHGVDSYNLGKWTDSGGVTHNNRTAIISPTLVEIDADFFRLVSGGSSQTVTEYIEDKVPVTVTLTSDSHVFSGDSEKALAQTFTFGVQAWRGTESVACEVVGVTGAPSGMTVTVGTVLTDSEGTELTDSTGTTLRDGDGQITVTLDGTMTDTVGVLDVEVTAGGVTFHKLFSWGVALTGKGTTITAKSVKYAVTSTATRPDSSSTEWSETFPTTLTDGQYLWTWTHVEYSTGDTTDAYSVSRVGIDGKGIQSSVIDYSLQESAVDVTTIADEDWGDFPAELTDGWWLYTRTTVVYSSGETTVSYDVSQVGTGAYYAGCQEYYAVGDSETTPPKGYIEAGTYPSDQIFVLGGAWQKGTRPSYTTGKPYLWNFEISYDSRGNQYVTAPVCIGNFAKGISAITETYAISAYSKPNVTTQSYPNDITSWTDEQQDAAPTKAKPYQWNKTETTYNDDTVDTFYHVSAVRGSDGEDGKAGKDGKDGADGEAAVSLRVIANATALQGVQVGDTVSTDSNGAHWLNITEATEVLTVGLFVGTEQVITDTVAYTVTSDDVSGIGSGETTAYGTHNIQLTTASKVLAEAWTSSTDGTQRYLPKTNPSILVTATYGGVKYLLTLPVTVDYTARWSEIYKDNEEIALMVNRVQTNINLIDTMPQPEMTEADFVNLFLDITLKAAGDGTLFQLTSLSSKGVTVPTFNASAKADEVIFARHYADYVDYYPKAGNALVLMVTYMADAAFTLTAGINGGGKDYITIDDTEGEWKTATFPFNAPSSDISGDSTDQLEVAFSCGDEGGGLLYIAAMTLQMAGGSLYQTMGYVDVKADEVDLGVRTDLNKTGINITDGTVTVDANNFHITNSSGETTFSVDKDGNLVGSGNASFQGSIECRTGYFGGMQRKTKTVITSSNYTEYIKEMTVNDKVLGYYIDFDNLTPWMVLDSTVPLEGGVQLSLPYIVRSNDGGVTTCYGDRGELPEEDFATALDKVRCFIGNRVTIYNNSGVALNFYGLMSLDSYLQSQSYMYAVYDKSDPIEVANGSFLSAECVCVNRQQLITSTSTGASTHVVHGEMVIWVASVGVSAG